eukprot:297719-Pleurochrysis_carterae.AAC.2
MDVHPRIRHAQQTRRSHAHITHACQPVVHARTCISVLARKRAAIPRPVRSFAHQYGDPHKCACARAVVGACVHACIPAKRQRHCSHDACARVIQARPCSQNRALPPVAHVPQVRAVPEPREAARGGGGGGQGAR